MAYKVFVGVLQRRLSAYAKTQIKGYQCGFRMDGIMTKYIFVIREIIEQCYEHSRVLIITNNWDRTQFGLRNSDDWRPIVNKAKMDPAVAQKINRI